MSTAVRSSRANIDASGHLHNKIFAFFNVEKRVFKSIILLVEGQRAVAAIKRSYMSCILTT